MPCSGKSGASDKRKCRMALRVLGLEKSRCTGCGVCADVCPENCIQMTADGEGFLYPMADAAQCTDCGKCAAVCPVMNPVAVAVQDNALPKAFAAWSLDAEIRYQSTSGGIFTELARLVLHDDGVVAGARYDGRNMVRHVLIEQEKDLPLLRQSKYAQSDTGDIYRKVLAAMDSGRRAIFSGTPCQCAAMKRYAEQTDNLILCDFICRGVNSPLVYAKYLEELEARHRAKVRRVWFKNKERGWNAFGTRIDFENGETYFGGREDDPFMFGYIRKGLNLYMCPSCGQCAFKGVTRPVDITLGDFWGVKLHESNDDMQNGVSAVIVHTEKGQRLFDAVSPNIYREEQDISSIHPANICLTETAAADAESRARFWAVFQQKGFNKAIRQFTDNGENRHD